MQIGWGQLLLIVLVGFVLFGNLPKIAREVRTGWQEVTRSASKETPKETKGPPPSGA